MKLLEAFLSPEQLADKLQINERTVRRWAKDGKIPCYRLGVEIRFNEPEIVEWILSRPKLPRKNTGPEEVVE